MTEMTIFLLVGALCMGVAGWLIFLAAMRTGQWDAMEDVKFQLFDDSEDEHEPA